jgi:hypothetical protein
MEIKKIILNGCSYTHGCDITFKENNIKPFTNFFKVSKGWNEHHWEKFNSVNLSGRLKKLFNCNDVVNLALPGFSNEYIASRTMDYIETNWKSIDPTTTIVMIGWTEFCRTVIYNETGCFNYSIPLIENYLKVFSRESPKSKDLLARIKFLENIKPLGDYYNNDTIATNTDYFRHVNLILMLQYYLKSKGINYVFWNSLINFPRMEFKKEEHPVQYNGIENLVDWSKWPPHGTRECYEIYWESLVRSNPDYRTESSHPSAEASLMWAERLFNFVNDGY